MNRIARFSSAAFGMVLLAGLAYYQGHPEMATGEEDSLVGTALAEPQVNEASEESAPDEAGRVECDPSKNPEDPDFKDCDKVSQK
jgi:hypothetical protein